LSKTKGSSTIFNDKAGYQYAYDYENRLTQITRPEDIVTATFEYIFEAARKTEKRGDYMKDQQKRCLLPLISLGAYKPKEE